MKKISLIRLREQAANRPAGYFAAVLAAGTVDGDYLQLTPCAYRALVLTYQPPALPLSRISRGSRFKLGDCVAAIAQPIARAVDRTFGTNLANCQPCKKRQARLNQIGT